MVRPGIGGWQLRRWQSTAETDRFSNFKILGYAVGRPLAIFFERVFVVVGLLRWRKHSTKFVYHENVVADHAGERRAEVVPNLCRVFSMGKLASCEPLGES